ncbi:MAG: ATP-binding protein [Planctomycetales bacterium]
MPRQELPQIDSRRCTLCGDCVAVCPTSCLEVARGMELVVFPRDCISCAVCEAICPVQAIAMGMQAW